MAVGLGQKYKLKKCRWRLDIRKYFFKQLTTVTRCRCWYSLDLQEATSVSMCAASGASKARHQQVTSNFNNPLHLLKAGYAEITSRPTPRLLSFALCLEWINDTYNTIHSRHCTQPRNLLNKIQNVFINGK